MPRCCENQSWMILSAVFVATVALQKKFYSPANFQEILGAYQRRIHMFCRPRESMWSCSSWKALGYIARARCWRVPLAGRQVTVFLFRRLCQCRRSSITTVQRWCWTPTMVCVVIPLLFIVYIRVLHTRPAGQIRCTKPFHPAAKHILPIMKHNIFKKNMLIW